MVPVAIAILLQPFIMPRPARRPGVAIPLAFIGRLRVRVRVVMVPILALWGGAGGLIIAAIAGIVALALGYRWLGVLGPDETGMLAALPLPGARKMAAILAPRASRADQNPQR
jgi:hypothetical protein